MDDFARIRLPAPEDWHRIVTMNVPVLDVCGDLSNEDVNLLLRPSQASREKSETEAFKTIEDVDLIPSAQLLHMRISRPCI